MEEQVEIKVREPQQICLWISLIPRCGVTYLICICSRTCNWGPQIVFFQHLYLGHLVIKDTYSEIIETSGGHLKKNLWWRPAVLSFCYFLLTKAWLQMASFIRGSEYAGLDLGVPHRRFVKQTLSKSLSECTCVAYHWFLRSWFCLCIGPKTECLLSAVTFSFGASGIDT